ncbi:NS1 [Bocaparvovirus primate3]|uniref:Initiator protein NS1 n=1 Tax=Bocaparvovirus primate3 TaxID=3052042 RepID=A0A517FM29_9VIRU|nr:NS1 [Bocaparvovirus primate3]QDS02905.1 NS1 [Bocaparvovirus primate3]
MAYSLPVIRAFSQPAFTYVVRFPWENWKEDEQAICSLLSPGLGDCIDRLKSCKPQPEEDPLRDDLLESIGDQHPLAIIAKACYKAMLPLWVKSNTLSCRDVISSSVRTGHKFIHCHVIVGGAGLSKRNAKIIKSSILAEFVGELIYRCRERLSQRPFDPDESAIFHNLKRVQREAWSGHCGGLVDILQYRDRRGELHAQSIDPLRFFANYLLPKNKNISCNTTPDICTPADNWVILVEKTYGHTLVNGLSLPARQRTAYRTELSNEVIGGPAAMNFGGRAAWEELPQVGEQRLVASTSSTEYKANKKERLMLNLLEKCKDLNLLTYEDLVSNCPDLLLMLEGQPGGARLIEQVLGMHHIKVCSEFTALKFLLHLHPGAALLSDNKAIKLLLLQGYNPLQVGHALCCILDKKFGKQNTVCFYGPASTGKTNLAKALVQAIRLYGNVNHLNKGFVFNDCRQRLVIWWEECLMHQDWVEPAKCILGGTECRIDVKHRDSVLLTQTPVVISTNHDIYTVVGGNTVSQVHAAPLKERVVQLNFMKQLPQTFGEITAEEIAGLLRFCFEQFSCNLNDFKNKWNLERVPNSFPLGKLCPAHSQDFILHENGFCTECGGYLPHSADNSIYTEDTSNSGDSTVGKCF